MKKLILGITFFILSLFVFTNTASACGKDQCGWILKGDYTIDYTLTGGGGVYSHVYTIDNMNKFTGEFSGTGHYLADASYTETITGKLVGTAITFHVVYTSTNAGYAVDATGTVDSTGQLSGTATGPGQTFTWTTSSGKAIKDCDHWGNWFWDKFKGWHEDHPGNGPPFGRPFQFGGK